MEKKFQANQYQADPRQELFLSYYLNPKSPTFSNVTQSGLKAGYSQEYSENIMHLMPEWLSKAIEKWNSKNLLEKAEKKLYETLEYSAVDEKGKIEISLLSIQNNTARFIAERLGKKRYSTKTETDITSGGEKIIYMPLDVINKLNGTNTETKGSDTIEQPSQDTQLG